jgi:hypothetical protein
MGYSEFGGGGSVLWHVRPAGDGSGIHGRDPKPTPAAGATFTIFLNGKQIARERVDFTNPRQVQIVWEPQTPADLPKLAAQAIRERLLMAASEMQPASPLRRGVKKSSGRGRKSKRKVSAG